MRLVANLHPGLFAAALVIAVILWGMAHSSSDVERGFDIPIVFQKIPDSLVMTDQSSDVVNIRVMGSPAALRNVSPGKLEFPVDVSGARPGPAIFEVDASRLDAELPSGARVVSRSPASIETQFELRGRKSLRIRADWEGQPADGYRVVGVATDPPRVWLAGARSAVLRMSEVVTEVIDVTGLSGPAEREARLSLGSEHIWMEEPSPVVVRIDVQPIATEAGSE